MGAVAKAVGIFSGCSTHWYKGILCAFKDSAMFFRVSSFLVYNIYIKKISSIHLYFL
jgi:hypothetical protein